MSVFAAISAFKAALPRRIADKRLTTRHGSRPRSAKADSTRRSERTSVPSRSTTNGFSFDGTLRVLESDGMTAVLTVPASKCYDYAHVKLKSSCIKAPRIEKPIIDQNKLICDI